MLKYTATDRKGHKLTPGGRVVFGPGWLAWLKKRQKRNGRGIVVTPVKKQNRIERMIAIANHEHGVHEQPPGSNSGDRVRQYQAATDVPGTGWPWCMAFIIWCATSAGIAVPYRGAYVPHFVRWAKQAGRIRKKPVRGFAVCFDWDNDGVADHIEQVTGIKRGTPTFYTDGGNTSQGDGSRSNGGEVVNDRPRQLSDVLCFVDMRHLPSTNTANAHGV